MHSNLKLQHEFAVITLHNEAMYTYNNLDWKVEKKNKMEEVFTCWNTRYTRNLNMSFQLFTRMKLY